jgi:ATP-dependent protease ClpP protease subunit
MTPVPKLRTDRNYWMSASEAIDYGVANKIISSIKDLK